VWWCKLGINIGFEQDGTGAEHSRSILVLKAFSAFVCLIVPLSTSTKKNRYYVGVGSVDGKEARAIISQVRLVGTRRLENKICVLDKATFGVIKKAVKDLL
jgi:mRNA interferase MazF